MFDNLVNNNFISIFNDAIKTILSENALTVPCTIKYGVTNPILCNNCIFDSLSNRSTNIYNNTGPSPFPEFSVCPVCNGMGMSMHDVSENIHLVVIFDSKYFLNWNSKTLNIPDGAAQTISAIETLPKIKNANSIIFNTNIANYALYEYIRDGEPTPCGLGDHKFISTMWVKK